MNEQEFSNRNLKRVITRLALKIGARLIKATPQQATKLNSALILLTLAEQSDIEADARRLLNIAQALSKFTEESDE